MGVLSQTSNTIMTVLEKKKKHAIIVYLPVFYPISTQISEI